jgi:hypothetical protein
MYPPPAGDSSGQSINARCQGKAQSMQVGAAHKKSSLPLKTCEGSDVALSLTIQQESNARINPRRAYSIQAGRNKTSMKGTLSRRRVE